MYNLAAGNLGDIDLNFQPLANRQTYCNVCFSHSLGHLDAQVLFLPDLSLPKAMARNRMPSIIVIYIYIICIHIIYICIYSLSLSLSHLSLLIIYLSIYLGAILSRIERRLTSSQKRRLKISLIITSIFTG
jgi:hypothetical protein